MKKGRTGLTLEVRSHCELNHEEIEYIDIEGQDHQRGTIRNEPFPPVSCQMKPVYIASMDFIICSLLYYWPGLGTSSLFKIFSTLTRMAKEDRNNAKRNSRRRKKRRTDFSSDLESSLSEESGNESDVDENNDVEEKHTTIKEAVEPVKEVRISDITLDQYVEQTDDVEKLTGEARRQIEELNEILSTETNVHNITIDTINEQKEKLANYKKTHTRNEEKKKVSESVKDEYLSLMMQSYGDDLDELRKAKDLLENSLPMLANLLREGASVFEYS